MGKFLHGLTLFSLVLCLPVLVIAQRKFVGVRIMQDESVVLDRYEREIDLKRKAFKIQVLLENVPGVYVFAAFNDSICCRLSEMDAIPGFNSLRDSAMKEGEFNPEKELLVNDRYNSSYWFYDPQLSWHPFNRKVIRLDTHRVVGIKSVKQLYYVHTQETIRLKDISKPLFLFFVAVSEFDSHGKPLKELMRRRVKINWTNDD